MKVYGIALVIGMLLSAPLTVRAQPWPRPEDTLRVERIVNVQNVLPVELQPAAEATLTESLLKASVNGKYRTLLRQLEMPEDAQEYGAFRDYGLFTGTEWKGVTDIPKGYWVYAQPYWYIWHDLTATPRTTRSWSTEQLVGAPNTEQAGDVPTAWASRTPDGQAEWLMLEYAEPMVPTGIKIYETYNPGAITKVTAFTLDGKEIELWHGTDPCRDVQNIGIFTLLFDAKFKTNRVKLYIDSPAVPGWNEIDAVGLIDGNKKLHWAVGATASSTYGETTVEPEPLDKNMPLPIDALPAIHAETPDDHITRLENEVKQLQEEVATMKALLNNQQRR
ncbi:MAG: hypothetical protein JO316_04510 [Abitibacteriaceae bacterium]|nr:hypothetical protein [Abditibacteriaceae bacterium]MBV9864588.1 hypothetical protein [Abditibacteriaceae bacterium]